MENTKKYRVLEIFFRGLRGEDISVQELANEYGVSTKSITRSINEVKDFLLNTGIWLATLNCSIHTAISVIVFIWTNFFRTRNCFRLLR
ncbi:MAG: helix-turn-helix domain-containing protein [Oscillospiraceae bacterium]|nr:helix-turn-helix domain-containing protein [Oscillospiraceae bacterium]